MGQIIPAGSMDLEREPPAVGGRPGRNVAPAGSLQLDAPIMWGLDQYLPDYMRNFIHEKGYTASNYFSGYRDRARESEQYMEGITPGGQDPDLAISEIMPISTVRGIARAAVTTPTTFALSGGPFIASGFKGYATYMREVWSGTPWMQALDKAVADIHEFQSRVPEFLTATPEEKKALEYLGLPFEYLDKFATMTGEGLENLIKDTMGIEGDINVAPAVSTLLNLYFLGKLNDGAQAIAKSPIRLAEIRNGAKRFQKWVDEGADPVKQPIPSAEIGRQPGLPVPPITRESVSKEGQKAAKELVLKRINEQKEVDLRNDNWVDQVIEAERKAAPPEVVEGQPDTLAEMQRAVAEKPATGPKAEPPAPTPTVGEIVEPGATSRAEAAPETPPQPKPRAKRITGPENVVTRIASEGGIDLSDQYNVKESEQFPDIARTHRKNGKKADEWADILNGEGYNVGSGDDLVELLKSGGARKVYTPDKAGAIMERDLARQQNEYIQNEIANLQAEAPGLDTGREALSNNQERLLGEVAAEGNLTPEQVAAARAELDSLLDEVSGKEPMQEPRQMVRDDLKARYPSVPQEIIDRLGTITVDSREAGRGEFFPGRGLDIWAKEESLLHEVGHAADNILNDRQAAEWEAISRAELKNGILGNASERLAGDAYQTWENLYTAFSIYHRYLAGERLLPSEVTSLEKHPRVYQFVKNNLSEQPTPPPTPKGEFETAELPGVSAAETFTLAPSEGEVGTLDTAPVTRTGRFSILDEQPTLPAEMQRAQEGPGAAGAKGPRQTPSDIVQLTDALNALEAQKLPLLDRISIALNLADTYSSAKGALNRGLERLTTAGKTFFQDLKSGELGKPKPYTEWDRTRDNYIGAYQISNLEAKRFAATIRNQIQDPLRREAITNWIQADGDDALLQRWADESRSNKKVVNGKRIAKGYEVAMNLSGEEKLFAENVKNYFESKLKEGIDAGLLTTGLSDYVPQMWKKQNPVGSKFHSDIAYGRLQLNPSFIRKRIFHDYFEGEQLGYEPTSKDIGQLITIYDQSFNKAIAARNFVKELTGMEASDGRPMVARGGKETVIEDPLTGETDAYLVKPKQLKAEYDDYRVVDHPSLGKWRWLSEDENGAPRYIQSDAWVHPEAYQRLYHLLKTSAIRENPIWQAALTTIATFKGTLLSLSGFHQTQVGLHAIFHGVNPFNVPKLDISAPMRRSLVEHGMIIADYKNMTLFHEGITSGGLISRVPGLGALSQKYTDWLFTDYIPRLKMKMGEEAYRRNLERYKGKMTDDQILSITADQANAAFGELNYGKLGRDPTVQDALRLMLLAPDFFEARARFVGQALRPYRGVPDIVKSPTMNEQGMAAIMRGTIGLYVGARIANAIINDGNTYHDKPFSVVVKGEEFTLRSIPGDVYHLLSDPAGFVFYRLNPTTTSPLFKLLLHRDQYGRYLTAEDWVKNFFASHTPIPLQGFTTSEKKLWESALASIGVSAFKYRTSFDRALMEESSQHMTVTSTPEERQRHKAVSSYAEEIQKYMKAGDGKKIDELTSKVEKDIRDKKLYMEDLNRIMDYSISDRTERYIKSLPVERVLSSWGKANQDEKRHYLPLMVERITTLMNEHPEKFEELLPKIEKLLQGKL